MNFESPLLEGTLIRRYKRFFADIEFNGETIVAHVPNTGSMMGLKDPGLKVRFSQHNDPKRKLKFTLEMVKTKTSWVGVNTHRPNKMVEELFHTKPLAHWKKFNRSQMEVKINEASRIDMVLWNSKQFDKKITPQNIWELGPLHFVEVKNVTLAENGIAMFPDAVTERGQKHLKELMNLVSQGHTAELLFTIQRDDCEIMKPADHIDPDYGKYLRDAKDAGVKLSALPGILTKKRVALSSTPIPIKL